MELGLPNSGAVSTPRPPVAGLPTRVPARQPTLWRVLWSVWGSRSGNPVIRSMVVSS